MKILKIIKSTILCIRFPFLYPRNRYSGLHYTNWKISKFLGTWIPLTQDTFFFEQEPEKNGWESILLYVNNIRHYTISVKDKEVSIEYNKKVIWKKPFSYFGEGEILGIYKDDKNLLHLCTSSDFKKNENSCWIINYTHAKWLANICKIVDWIYKYLIQWIHCIPTFTELDSMPIGWRKAFGIQMCKEIKAELKKIGYLRKYRITQIKEKYGSLRWYDAGNNVEIQNIIDKYEEISTKTCINCGKPAKYISRGWISPYCENCIDKNFEYDRI